ncbi:type III pantothenate kinase [Oxalobacteraceae bacterium GrIS 2.11]
MLLLIDAGNTRIKWALADPSAPLGSWTHSGVMSHQEFAQQAAPWASHVINRAIVSNVAGTALRERIADALRAQVEVEWFASQLRAAGVLNHYRDPEQLGCDRFAAAIGAHALYPNQHLIIATCGTATTVDAVTAQGDFIGGMIVPGLQLMARSLASNTAQLPHVDNPSAVALRFAKHTEDAIISGCLAAQVGAIEYAAHNFTTLGSVPILDAPFCILSGGAAQYITPNLRVSHRLVDNLVLIGLQAFSSC